MGLLTSHFSTKRLSLISRSLATTYSSGIPVNRCLDLLARKGMGRSKRYVFTCIKEDIEQGLSLEEALRNQSDYIPALFIEVIAAGESSGSLDAMFQSLADHYEEQLRIQRSIMRQVTYPVCIVIAAISINFIRDLVIAFFNNGDIKALVINYIFSWKGTAAKFCIIYVALSTLARTGILKRIIDPIVIYIWPISILKRKFVLARFFKCMGLMLQSGQSIMKCIERSAAATSNLTMEREILKTIRPIQCGESVSEAFNKLRLVTINEKQMIGIGEQSGRLDIVSLRLSNQLYKEAAFKLRVIISLLEAILIIFVAFLIF